MSLKTELLPWRSRSGARQGCNTGAATLITVDLKETEMAKEELLHLRVW